MAKMHDFAESFLAVKFCNDILHSFALSSLLCCTFIQDVWHKLIGNLK